MIIYPAIDIIDGKAVRLSQGKFDDVTVFNDIFQLMLQKIGLMQEQNTFILSTLTVQDMVKVL